MGKKNKGGGADDFWGGVQGWKNVTVNDDLLLGSDEYGFCGLEELDGSSLGTPPRGRGQEAVLSRAAAAVGGSGGRTHVA